ncbi:class I SAM-dependent methyltransferase [Lederbergia citrea]|uniref:Class I SAM-dependent methyltransferase n=1 Tax=Lederbergia citrea TaxID=2833581 RepID=A0A942UPJ0_9BACI|nr:class I SAM-dependent methyltransferase [Lederbergia citrea]MBS4223672.1 class I SAM-dependent methyltransferase [Lederbergia citrea]
MEKEKLVRIFDRQAGKYEKNKETAKQRRWRENLISHAEGEVLELAVGAGANFSFYSSGVKVTAIDFSEAMLDKAKHTAQTYCVETDFICSEIEKMNFPNDSFDTIVSTLSFCSYENPLMMLKKIQDWCRPNGKILLMEHGISPNFVVSTVQKALDPLLYRMIGCHQTRNIPELIRESGLSIDRVESHYFKMLHVIWAKPGVSEV